MLATVQTIADVVEELAPLEYALDSDGSGLLLGEPGATVKRVMVALDLTDIVLREAVESDADMLVLHHPPFYRPVQQFRYDRLPGKLLLRAVGAGLAMYAAHTNLDVAPGGVNDILAHLLELDRVCVMAETGRERLHKLVVFVPQGHEDRIRDALAGAGAGHIGNYSHCTFQGEGEGTFKPLSGSDPFVGQVGELERVSEIRLETIVPASRRERAVAAMCEAHPYEEVAYDLYPLANPGLPRGLARAGLLAEPVTLDQFADRACRVLGTDRVRIAGDLDRSLTRVVVCAGRLAPTALEEAVNWRADVVLTGEIRYHELLQATQLDMSVVEVGHFCSERPVVRHLAEILSARLRAMKLDTAATWSRNERDPARYS